jgi:hypothetical protein
MRKISPPARAGLSGLLMLTRPLFGTREYIVTDDTII